MYIGERLFKQREGSVSMTDKKIVELFWARSESAITETAAKYQHYCLSIAYNILRNSQDANECVNDTYWKTWNAIPIARPNRLSTFLGKITRNLSIDYYKKKHAERRGGGTVEIALSELKECVPSADSVEQEIEGNLLTETINHFLGGLSKQQRVIFVCRYWYFNTTSEIAADLGISESNVKTTLFRVRNKLKNYLKEAGIYL